MTVQEDPIAAVAEMAIEHLNAEHADALALIASAFGGGLAAEGEVQACGVDAYGICLSTPSGLVRVPFEEPVADLMMLRASIIGLVNGARDVVGEVAPTSVEREVAAEARYRTFVTTVVGRTDLNPKLLQLTFGGGDLVECDPVGGDPFVYVLAPPAGRSQLTVDRDFTWAAHEEMAVADRPRGAYYSVRRWRPEVAEMDLIVVRHEGGQASEWAEHAQVGDPVAVWGPREIYAPPADTVVLLLVADETGLPALATILERRTTGLPAVAIIEVEDPSVCIPLATTEADRIVWLWRGSAAPGTTTALLDEVRRTSVPPLAYAWGGAESATMTKVRRHLRDDIGLEQHRVHMTGYWRLPHDQP